VQDLSISIVVFELDRVLLKKCLDSLLVAIANAKEENLLQSALLTLVDNATNQPALQLALDELKLPSYVEPRLVSGHGNVGYGAAHNLAIMTSDKMFHLILNPDVILARTSLTEILRFMLNHPEVCMTAPHGETPSQNNAHLCKRYPSVLALFVRGFAPRFARNLFANHLRHYEYHDLDHSAPTLGIELISGCCMFARTSALKAVGGFDPRYFLYFEDFDLSKKISQIGKIAYLPDAKIIHYGGESASKGLQHSLYFCRSAFRFYRTHGLKIT
jgi:GT2 family glycosyltransferase